MKLDIRTFKRTISTLVMCAVLLVGASAEASAQGRWSRNRHDNGRHLGWTRGRHRGWQQYRPARRARREVRRENREDRREFRQERREEHREHRRGRH